MDSGNSGSMQSSSGGGGDVDESYDSRVETSISAFLGPTVHRQQHQPSMQHHRRHHQHHQQQVEFDSLSNIFDVSRETSNSTNPLLNLDMVWPTNKPGMMRSDGQNHNLMSQPFLTHSQLGVQVSGGGAGGGGGPSTTFTQIPNDQPITTNNNNNNNVGSGGGVRSTNPKKRSRASRRAPTTVLTTDTTNFRAMVQEFTGIPAPPFTSSSSFPRSRLDLFGSSSSARSIPGHQNSNHTIPDLASSLPPYLLSRPFPQRASLPNAIINNSPLLNINPMQNPPSSSSSSVLNFHSLFQNPQQNNLQKYPLPGNSGNVLGSPKSSQGSLGNLREDQFGLSHGLNIHQQHRTSTLNWVGNSNKNEGNVDLLRSINGNNQGNYGASSSSNVIDNVGAVVQLESDSNTARNEGMDQQEPWICTSD